MNRKAPVAALFCMWLLAGTAVLAQEPAPKITVTPSAMSFGPVCVGGSHQRTVTIKNEGDEDLSIDDIVRASGSSSFALASDPSPITLAPQQTASFSATFSSALPPGDRKATFAISSDDPDNEVLPVGAVGTVIHRLIAVDPSSVGFGEQRVGTRSPTKVLRLRNPGQDTVTVTAINRGGANGGEFVVAAPALPLQIAKGDFKDIAIAFQPSGAGLRKGTLQIVSNSCTSPNLAVSLVGTGVLPDVVVQPNPVDVGNAPVGEESGPTSVTVSNDGAASLQVTAVQIVGENASDFALANLPAFPRTLPPGESFVFSIRMTAGAEGLRVASINVISDDPDAGTFGVPVRGTATPASPSPTPSATATASVTPTPSSPSPSVEPGTPVPSNDSLAIGLVVGGVLSAFVGLIVVRRFVRDPEDVDAG